VLSQRVANFAHAQHKGKLQHISNYHSKQAELMRNEFYPWLTKRRKHFFHRWEKKANAETILAQSQPCHGTNVLNLCQ
jgi:hypothetical protein